eukprot:CAMPEP_0173209992 /NCGR_PEP_ID=MMETSP1141-20130122/23412_1 /TAXON_ID=483371 /ORGANISM="non described non described, Strain CCMP2298" /LENGTH=225 /DNA_ID=CAMNT_0014136681 /DNA_START=228 /DNA_END=901 /DNA_ORIENTATION=-
MACGSEACGTLVELFVIQLSFGIILECLNLTDMVTFENSLNPTHLDAFRKWIQADHFTLSQSQHGTIVDIFELDWVLSRRVAVESLSLWGMSDHTWAAFEPYIVQCGNRLRCVDLHTRCWGREEFEHLLMHCPGLTSISGVDELNGDLILTHLHHSLEHVSFTSSPSSSFVSSLFDSHPHLVSMELIVKNDVRPLMAAIAGGIASRLEHLKVTLKCTKFAPFDLS